MCTSFWRAIVLCVVTFTFAIAGAAQAQAQQTKTAKAKCPANYYESCLKKCGAVGGRIAGCPQYCTKRQAELGC